LSNKKPKAKKSRGLLGERNRIRGLIGASKSRHVDLDPKKKRDQLQRTRQFQRSLSVALLQARKKISTSQFDTYLGWLEGQMTALLSEYGSYATNSELLGDVLNAQPLPLHKEILWIVSRLLQHEQLVRAFLSEVAKLELIVWSASWEEIDSILTHIEKTFGKTLWILEARIALEQDFRGLESQKKIAKTERQLSTRGLTTFASHHISVRNEPTTVLNRFVADFETRLDPSMGEPLKHFLHYRIANRASPGQRSLAGILQISQGLAEIDLYEALIFAAQQLIADGTDTVTSEALITGLTRLRKVEDPRIDKMLLLLGAPGSVTFATRNMTSADAVLESPSFSVLKLSLRALQADPRDFKAAMLAAAQLNRRSRKRTTARIGWPTIISLMGDVLTYSSTYESDLDALEKLLINHAFLPHVRACHSCFTADMRCTLSPESRARRIGAINNPFLDPDELCLLPPRAVKPYMDSLVKTYGESPTLLWNTRGLQQSAPDARCRPFSANLCIETDGGLADLTELSQLAQTAPNRWRTVFASLTSVQAEIYQNNTPQVVKQIADLYLEKQLPLAVIPVAIGIGHLKWRQLKPSSTDLALAVALHLYWRATNSEQAATNVRFAYDVFLENLGLTTATSLAESSSTFDVKQLTYFLRHVCVPSVMDMNRHIASSKAAESERRRICSLLCELDPVHRVDYEAEIVSIVNAEALEEGIRVVDSSRVHVDTNAIKAWIKREWEPNFGRYKALVEAGVGRAQNIDVVLREVLKRTNASVIYLQTPESEADSVLIELMVGMRKKFLLDPQHGLDSYLSRRVRHHSMGGYLRGPL
jgi:hypothetical protein